jgi:hypothetical protein
VSEIDVTTGKKRVREREGDERSRTASLGSS